MRALGSDERIEEIVGVARRRPRDLQLPRTVWRQADVAQDDLAPHLAGADAVVHLAWLIQPSRDERTTHRERRGLGPGVRGRRPSRRGTIVYASSVGAYSEGPKDRAVDESWPTEGIVTSFYSRHKAAVERILDSFEAAHPGVRVVRLRPGLIFQREAASEIRRLFAGPLLPSALLRRRSSRSCRAIPACASRPCTRTTSHEAYRLAVLGDHARGAYNVAADPVLDGERLAKLLGARAVRVPAAVLRAGADLTWRARLQPTPAGWVDMGARRADHGHLARPLRAGLDPGPHGEEAFMDLFEGMRDGAGFATPPLDPGTGGPARSGEVLTGVGARNP